MKTDTDMEVEVVKSCSSIIGELEHLLDLIGQNGPGSHAPPTLSTNVKYLCDVAGGILNICAKRGTGNSDSVQVTTESLWKAALGLFQSCSTTLSRLAELVSAGKGQVQSRRKEIQVLDVHVNAQTSALRLFRICISTVEQDPDAQQHIDVSKEQCLRTAKGCNAKTLSSNINTLIASGTATGSISTAQTIQLLSDTADIARCIDLLVKAVEEGLDDLNSHTPDTSSPNSSFDLNNSSDAENEQMPMPTPRICVSNVVSQASQTDYTTVERLRTDAISAYKASTTEHGYAQAEQKLKLVLDHMTRLSSEEKRHLRVHDLTVKYVASCIKQDKWDNAESRLGALVAMKAKPGSKPVILYSKYLLAKIYLHDGRLDEAELLIDHMTSVYSRPNRRENPAPQAWKVLRERLVEHRLRLGDMQQMLHEALKDPDVDMIRLLLKLGPSCGFKDSKPLFLAILEIISEEEGIDYDAIKQVLDLDPSLLKLELEKTTLLNAAIKRDDYRLTEILLDSGANADFQGYDDYTPLLCAVHHASWRILQLLLKRGAEAKRRIPGYHTALDQAIRQNKFDMVLMLTEGKLDLNAKDYDGYTPLHSAVQRESLNIVRHLVTKSARTNVTLEDGQTPLHLAVRKRVIDENTLQIIAYLAAESNIYELDRDGKSSVEYALFHTSEEVLPKVLGANKSIDGTVGVEHRPLLKAVACGNVEKARRALEHGANPNKLKTNEFSPLVRAIRLSNMGMIDLLLNHEKMRVNNDNKSSENPIICAIKQNKLAIVKKLLDKRASLLVNDDNGRPSLFCAIDQGDAQMVEVLLAHGSLVDGTLSMRYEDLDAGTTPLHYAVVCGKRDILEVLLRHKPSPSIDAINEAALTPYQLAHTKGLEDMKTLLANHGANTTPPPKQRRSIWSKSGKA